MKILLLKEGDRVPPTLNVFFLPPTYTGEAVEVLFEVFKNSENYLVVSNAHFFDFLEFNSWEEVRDTFYTFENGKIKNIPETLAKEIWADVETDFLHVSEILRNKNLY